MAQMIVSADSIRNDSEARAALVKKVRAAGTDILDDAISFEVVGLIIATDRPLTAHSLSTFYKVILLQMCRFLKCRR